MELKDLLGSDYKENMTQEEVNAIFEKRVLASGKYENKEKVDAERAAHKKALDEAKATLKGKLSEEELSKSEVEELKRQLEESKTRELNFQKEISRGHATSGIAEAKTLLGIKEDDKDYIEFITNISGADSEITKKTSSYVGKLVKDAYEKGKAEATKTTLGEMGNMVIGKDGKPVDKEQAFIKDLIKQTPASPKIENSNFI